MQWTLCTNPGSATAFFYVLLVVSSLLQCIVCIVYSDLCIEMFNHLDNTIGSLICEKKIVQVQLPSKKLQILTTSNSI